MVQPINDGINNQINLSVYKQNPVSAPATKQNEPTNLNGYMQHPKNTISAFELAAKDDLANLRELLLDFMDSQQSIKEFTPGTRESERNKIIEEEKKHLSQLTRERTEYNTRQLKSAGVKDADVKKYLKTDGHVTEEGKRLLREKGKSYK